MSDPFRRSLEEWDGEYPEAWLPKPDEVLVGQLVRYERGSTTYGPADIAVILDEDTGQERSVWLLHEVLRREFREQLPRPGERLGLKRLEDGRNQHGQKYQKWALRVDRKGGAAPRFLQETADDTQRKGNAPVPQEIAEPKERGEAREKVAESFGTNRAGDFDDDLPF